MAKKEQTPEDPLVTKLAAGHGDEAEGRGRDGGGVVRKIFELEHEGDVGHESDDQGVEADGLGRRISRSHSQLIVLVRFSEGQSEQKSGRYRSQTAKPTSRTRKRFARSCQRRCRT